MMASTGGCFVFFGVGGASFGLWHLGQKKNPARTATMKRQTRTTIAVIAAGPTGLGRRGIVGGTAFKRIHEYNDSQLLMINPMIK